jgi:hypothetical protein
MLRSDAQGQLVSCRDLVPVLLNNPLPTGRNNTITII